MARTVGTPNRNTQFLTNKLRDMYGDDFDPIIKAAENAVRMQDLADSGDDDEFNMRKDCVAAWEKIGQYCSPKLKAVEVSGTVATMSHEQWLEIIDDDKA